MKNSEVNFQAPLFREKFGPQHCKKGGVQGGMWLRLIIIAEDLTCCSGQRKLKSRPTICLGLHVGLKLFCSPALLFFIKQHPQSFVNRKSRTLYSTHK